MEKNMSKRLDDIADKKDVSGAIVEAPENNVNVLDVIGEVPSIIVVDDSIVGRRSSNTEGADLEDVDVRDVIGETASLFK